MKSVNCFFLQYNSTVVRSKTASVQCLVILQPSRPVYPWRSFPTSNLQKHWLRSTWPIIRIGQTRLDTAPTPPQWLKISQVASSSKISSKDNKKTFISYKPPFVSLTDHAGRAQWDAFETIEGVPQKHRSVERPLLSQKSPYFVAFWG